MRYRRAGDGKTAWGRAGYRGQVGSSAAL